MVFQSQSGYIFGGYSPYQWLSDKSWVQDDSLSSFLFSQTHDQIYPLKQEQKQYAICCNSGFGPAFGGGSDRYINSDFKSGNSKLGDSYEWNKQQKEAYNHLFGQDKPILECEIFELKFM
ncbi:unnamed protein product [Paramecium sonneborni]|uniref:TLDc domain-containing protein n=1 Tax=Paramecium sonneborni TaxID=65129 RepID=A0A8S1RUK8_9CILI|nr:unnamed protein product [Paramecium sonneborni]